VTDPEEEELCKNTCKTKQNKKSIMGGEADSMSAAATKVSMCKKPAS
jgi:hypothetical protein